MAPLDLEDRGYDEARGRAFLMQLEERIGSHARRPLGMTESLVLTDQRLRRTISDFLGRHPACTHRQRPAPS